MTEWTWSQVSRTWKVKIESVHTACIDLRLDQQPTVTAIIEAIGWLSVEFEKTPDQSDKERLDFEIVKEVLRNMNHLRGKPVEEGQHSIRVAGALIGILHVSSERIFR